MRFFRTAIIAGVASATLAGAALAGPDDGKWMLIALPDGSVQHIRFTGDATPSVLFAPARESISLHDIAFRPDRTFADIARLSAAMAAQADAMMRQAATMHTPMPAHSGDGVIIADAQGRPVGTMQYSYMSSTTDARGCTRTVQYSSDGITTGNPRVIRTSSAECHANQLAPQAKPVTPTAASPARKPAPKIIPVSTIKPQHIFTPSPT